MASQSPSSEGLWQWGCHAQHEIARAVKTSALNCETELAASSDALGDRIKNFGQALLRLWRTQTAKGAIRKAWTSNMDPLELRAIRAPFLTETLLS